MLRSDSSRQHLPMHGATIGDEMTDAELRQRMLDWRGVDDPCLQCDGSGRQVYGSTATWRGGMGGATMTADVCSTCWGSGDRYRHGANLRMLRSEESKRIAERAVNLLADSCGVQFKSSWSDVHHLILEFDKILDRRKDALNVFRRALLLGLRNVLARAVNGTERKE